MKKIIRTQLFWVSLFTLIIFVVMTFLHPSFNTSTNFHNLSRNAAFFGIMALGQSWVLLIGGIDLSIGSTMALSAMVTAISMHQGSSFLIGLSLGMGTALLCGLINGLLIARFRLSPFVVTLGSLSVYRSLTLVISNNQMIYEFGPEEALFLSLGSQKFMGLSFVSLICLLIAIFSTFVLTTLQLGRHLYAVGGNPEACYRHGVGVRRVKVYAYCFSSLCAGLAGILSLSWLGSAQSGLGTGYELPAIAATVLGGFSLSGGIGVPCSPLVGAFLIELIRNSLLLLGVESFWQGTVVGLALIGAISIDRIFSKREVI